MLAMLVHEETISPLPDRQDEAGAAGEGTYTVREAAVLASSSVPGQRAAGLRLLAAVLEQVPTDHELKAWPPRCCRVSGIVLASEVVLTRPACDTL